MKRSFGLKWAAWMALAAISCIAVYFLFSARKAPSKEADALLSGLIKTNDPGLAVLVAQDGKILFEGCYGGADLEHHVPVIPQTIFRIGSISKQFTASAILKLQEDGKLSVNDKLSKYIPDFPRGDEVTLRQLLNHTSGIHDYAVRLDWRVMTNATTTEAFTKQIEKGSYDFDPGTKWSYDNSGYVLLGHVVEKVSGQSYGDFLRESFFQPLGMTNTGVYHAQYGLPHEAVSYVVRTNTGEWVFVAAAVLPHEAVGYSLRTNRIYRERTVDPSWAIGYAALYSTVEDLYRWNEGLFNGRVLDAASLKAAFTPVTINETQVNSDCGYGFGWFITRDRGLRQILHTGAVPGFLSVLLRLPDEKFTVAVLANARPGQTNANPIHLAQQLVEIYLADKLAPPPMVNRNVSPKSYDALTGRYGLQGKTWTISKRGPHLFFQRGDQPEEVEIFPLSETEFFWDGAYAQFTFVKDSSGKAVKLIIHRNGMEMDEEMDALRAK